MPHDRNGSLVEVGATANIPCRVTAVQPGEEFCNTTVETLGSMQGNGTKMTITLNTHQIEIVRVDPPPAQPDGPPPVAQGGPDDPVQP